MEVGYNGNWYGFVASIVFVAVIRIPHVNPLLAGFVRLRQAEARLIKIKKIPFVIVHYYGSRK